jgi:hypothetical protein
MAQFLYPNTDVNTGAWSGSPINNKGNLYQNIDEVTTDESDFVRAQNNPRNSKAIFGLSSGATPQTGTRTLNVRWRVNTSGGGSHSEMSFDVRLLDSTNSVIQAAPTVFPPTNFLIWVSLNLIITESISDYSALRVEVEASQIGGSQTGWIEVARVRFQIPDEATGGNASKIYLIT